MFHQASGMVPQKQSLRDVKHKFSKRNSKHPLIRGWNTWPVWDVENEQRLSYKWSPNGFFPAWRTVDKFMTSGFQPFCLAIISICNCVKSYVYIYMHLTSLRHILKQHYTSIHILIYILINLYLSMFIHFIHLSGQRTLFLSSSPSWFQFLHGVACLVRL